MKRALMVVATCAMVTTAGAVSAGTVERWGGAGAGAFSGTQYYGAASADRQATLAEREGRIGHRIERGLNDGGLTRWEARRLYRELAYVRHKEQAFRADGRIDRYEFAELNADLDRLAQRVRAERWDEQRRYVY